MGVSLRAYGRHRRVSLAAVQKALKTRRIMALPDGTIDPEIADRAWDVAAEVRRTAHKVPADPTRVVLRPGSLATAEATVRAVLVEMGHRPTRDSHSPTCASRMRSYGRGNGPMRSLLRRLRAA